MNDGASPPVTYVHLPLLVRWTGFVAACIGMFMAILDIQIVVTALPQIQEALDIGQDHMSWVQTCYLIAEVVAIPLIGLGIRVFSMRWLFVAAITAFSVSSIGCALSTGFYDLVVWRVVQGFAGGILIPLVFSGIFLLFPKGIEQTLATTFGGFLAVLAPTFGPVAGGWITEHYSWHWLFLINVLPGMLALVSGLLCLPRAEVVLALLGKLDWLSLLAFGCSLALLIIGIKEAPNQGWTSQLVLGCFMTALALLIFSIKRPEPAIMFHLMNDRALAFGSALSFLLGFVLFSAVYILPVFLAFVRNHGPLDIGLITIVMGMVQIIAAPLIVQIDRRFDARLLTAIGFTIFAIGLAANARLTTASDYHENFWPQVLRGCAVALCILPPIRLALALQPLSQVNDASGLFNVVRNIGGAIGIAVMDTVMFTRSPEHADRILDLIKSEPDKAALHLGLTRDELPAPDDAMSLISIMEVVEDAALTSAINECWWVLAGTAMLSLPLLLWLGPVPSAVPVAKKL